MRRALWTISCMALVIGTANRHAVAAEPTGGAGQIASGLVVHLPLAGDARDHSGNERHVKAHGRVDFDAIGPSGDPKTAAAFNGRNAQMELSASTSNDIVADEFTLVAWVELAESADDVPGDIISQYDPVKRRGIHLSIKNNAGVANTQANYRQLQFGIDNNRQSEWTDCGRPGSTILAFALTVYDGHLYAGTCEPGEKQSGHVYRYAGNTEWIDCGAPDTSNTVTTMAVYDGHLYAGTGKYRLRGSALEESKNANLGGRIFRYDGGTSWTDCGQLPQVEATGALAVFRGKLYASSLYRPAGFFRYEGGTEWTNCGTPGKRVEALGVYDGYIYATSYDGGRVFRYDGTQWTDCGQLGPADQNTQTYSFAVYGGRLYVGTWRTGRVYRFEGIDRWKDVGRLGEELEVMGMLVHNGRLVAGTLPLAEVYLYEGNTTWQRLARLDHTPAVRYRRAWTMAEFQGRLFCSTLPSGHVYSYAAGTSAMWDHEFPPGWHHVAAVKGDGPLRLYVDGKLVAESASYDPRAYDLTSDAPLRIGIGQNDYFHGRMSDVRCYDRALSQAEIAPLASRQ